MKQPIKPLDPSLSESEPQLAQSTAAASTSLPSTASPSSSSYDFDNYLPPYRSLINPNKGYDYRSHRYFDPRGRTDGKLFSRYKSLIITPISNTTHKIRDAASDGFSIKSHKSRHGQCKLNLLDLPQEVLIGVFRILRRTDLAGLIYSLYVSKDFYKLAKVALYEDPYITSGFRLAQFVQTINMNSQLALMVQNIDLSHIRVGVDLKEDELAKFSSNIVFGSCGGQYDESLMENGHRDIYAGWRDFKYRFDATYGNLAHRSVVSTSFVPTHYLPASFTRPPVYSPTFSESGRKGSMSTMYSYSSLSMSSHNSYSSSDSIGSLFSMYDSNRRSRSSDHIARSEVAVHANADIASRDSNLDMDLDNVDGPTYLATLGGPYESHGNGMRLQKPGFFNSMSLFMRATLGRMSHSERRRRSQYHRAYMRRIRARRESRVSRCSMNFKRKLGLLADSHSSILGKNNLLYVPFGTPHPQQSDSLKQFCFARDIPVGYILHILGECKNLRSLNLSGIAWTVDFELEDYQYFDWELAKGIARSHGSTAGQYEYKSMLLESDVEEGKKRRESELAPYRINKPIYWSDTVREINFNDPGLHSLTIDAIWPYIMQLKQLEKVSLKNCVWLNKETIRDLVFDSYSRYTLNEIDCSDSGLVKNSGWARHWTADELKDFLNGKGAVGMD